MEGSSPGQRMMKEGNRKGTYWPRGRVEKFSLMESAEERRTESAGVKITSLQLKCSGLAR